MVTTVPLADSAASIAMIPPLVGEIFGRNHFTLKKNILLPYTAPKLDELFMQISKFYFLEFLHYLFYDHLDQLIPVI